MSEEKPQGLPITIVSNEDAWLEDQVRRSVWVTTFDKVIDLVDSVYNWGRRNSIWPMQFGLACCAIEMICTAAGRFDIGRFGSEIFRSSPRQADLMIVAGTVTKKMVPQIVRLYNQMAEPKYVMAMGACASAGGPFKEGYGVVSGIDKFLPVDVYVPGCPPTPQALLNGLIALQKKIDKQSIRDVSWYRRGDAEGVPEPILGPDLIDVRRKAEIKELGADPEKLAARAYKVASKSELKAEKQAEEKKTAAVPAATPKPGVAPAAAKPAPAPASKPAPAGDKKPAAPAAENKPPTPSNNDKPAGGGA